MYGVPKKLGDDVRNQIMAVYPSMTESRNGISRRVLGQGWKQPVYRMPQSIGGNMHVDILSAAYRRFDANFQYIRGRHDESMS